MDWWPALNNSLMIDMNGLSNDHSYSYKGLFANSLFIPKIKNTTNCGLLFSLFQ